mmetsp:Transcript_13214/g.23970  ORF Transcript_13214/g.23970 Transcript_13214/m.23970 type:complete len:457 (-) Transcript_13214:64-1434(-)
MAPLKRPMPDPDDEASGGPSGAGGNLVGGESPRATMSASDIMHRHPWRSLLLLLLVLSYGLFLVFFSGSRHASLVAVMKKGMAMAMGSIEEIHRQEECPSYADILRGRADRSSTKNLPAPYHIFTCGWPNDFAFAKMIFMTNDDTYNNTLFGGSSAYTGSSNASKYDLMIFGEHGPCPALESRSHFPGVILWFNGESQYDDEHHGPCDFILGPSADGNHTLRSPFGARLESQRPKEIRDEIFVQSKRPKSTKEYFMIYANNHCVDYRDAAAMAFAQIAYDRHRADKSNRRSTLVHRSRVDACPRGRSQTAKKEIEELTEVAPKEIAATNWGNNRFLFRPYRFCLVMENVRLDGYMTEKIYNAFHAGCIPIWYGTTDVFDIFNRDAFIYYDIEDPQPSLDLVSYLETNKTAYDEMLLQPILANGAHTIDKYFSFGNGIGNGTMKRRIRAMIGLEGTN